MLSNTELLYKLAMHYPVLKMVPGLSFWRQHDDQEITKGQESFFYLENANKHQVKTLQDRDLPLTSDERK
jgi:hypothetical protein